MAEFKVDFGPNAKKPPVTLPGGKDLAEVLTVQNSPILFGCRTGICGTCLSKVTDPSGTLPPPDQDEKDVLEILCPDQPKARLACRIRLSCDLTIEPIKLSV
jgi:ferredoxin